MACSDSDDSDAPPTPAETSLLLELDTVEHTLAAVPNWLGESSGSLRFRVGDLVVALEDDGDVTWRAAFALANPIQTAEVDATHGVWITGTLRDAGWQPYLARIDEGGALAWAHAYDLPASFEHVDFASLLTSSGCALAVAYWEGDAFEPTLVQGEVALFDSTGALQFALQASVFARPELEFGNGDLLISGAQRNLLSSAPESEWDLALARVTPLGDVVWQSVIGTPGHDHLAWAGEAPDGGIYVALQIQLSSPGDAAGVAKLDDTGALVSGFAYGPAPTPGDSFECDVVHAGRTAAGDMVVVTELGDRALRYLRLDSKGKLAAASTLAHGGSQPTVRMLADGTCFLIEEDYSEHRLWVGCVDPDGALLWEHEYGAPQLDVYAGAELTAAGTLLLVGQSGPHYDDRVGGLTPARRVWIVEIDADGDIVAQHASAELAARMGDVTVARTPTGGVLVGGSLEHQGSGACEAYLASFAPDGQLEFWNGYRDSSSQWHRRVTALARADGGFQIAAPFEHRDAEGLFYARLGADGIDRFACMGAALDVRTDLVSRRDVRSTQTSSFVDHSGLLEQAARVELFTPSGTSSVPYALQMLEVGIHAQPFCGF